MLKGEEGVGVKERVKEVLKGEEIEGVKRR